MLSYLISGPLVYGGLGWLLDRWLGAGQPPPEPARSEVAEVLDRLVVAAQLRYPAVGDLARAVRYRSFEEPVLRQARQAVLAEAERLLDELDAAGDRLTLLFSSPPDRGRGGVRGLPTTFDAPSPNLSPYRGRGT